MDKNVHVYNQMYVHSSMCVCVSVCLCVCGQAYWPEQVGVLLGCPWMVLIPVALLPGGTQLVPHATRAESCPGSHTGHTLPPGLDPPLCTHNNMAYMQLDRIRTVNLQLHYKCELDRIWCQSVDGMPSSGVWLSMPRSHIGLQKSPS